MNKQDAIEIFEKKIQDNFGYDQCCGGDDYDIDKLVEKETEAYHLAIEALTETPPKNRLEQIQRMDINEFTKAVIELIDSDCLYCGNNPIYGKEKVSAVYVQSCYSQMERNIKQRLLQEIKESEDDKTTMDVDVQIPRGF